MKRQFKMCTLAAAMAALPTLAFATNGMNMEGYGPVALGMGGASMAYDNGTAALMNNPATLGLMSEQARLDVALGFLGPDVNNDGGPFGKAKSSADAFYMPAIGYARKSGPWTYGVGMFGQGGMGTEYAGNTFMSAGSGQVTRSELSVGRLLAPISYTVSPELTIAGTVDYVWAGLDLQMAMSGGQFLGMAMGSPTAGGMASGSMVNGFMSMVSSAGAPKMLQAYDPTPNPGNPMMPTSSPVNWGYFDFSNSDKFTGEAKSSGYGAKIGAVWKASSSLTVGAAYHSKTSLSDMTSDSATVSFNVNVDNAVLAGGAPTGAGYTAVTIPVKGKISVNDFEWPSSMSVGVAFQATNELMVVADWQRVGWEAVMKNFDMTFTADTTQANPMAAQFGGAELKAQLYQNWKDQDVIHLGAAYRVSPELTVRGGYSKSDNPIPEALNNPLFPAIVETHYTLGLGYAFSKMASVDFALTVAPETKVTNGAGIVTTHSQSNWQLMYSQRY